MYHENMPFCLHYLDIQFLFCGVKQSDHGSSAHALMIDVRPPSKTACKLLVMSKLGGYQRCAYKRVEGVPRLTLDVCAASGSSEPLGAEPDPVREVFVEAEALVVASMLGTCGSTFGGRSTTCLVSYSGIAIIVTACKQLHASNSESLNDSEHDRCDDQVC